MTKRSEAKAKGRKRGWKQWTPREARAVLKSWRRSGLPLATYARRRGIGPERLRWWRVRFEKAAVVGEKRPGAKEVPVAFAPVVTRAPLVPLGGTALVVRVPGGAVLEIADVGAVPPSWMSEFLAAATRGSR